MGRLRNRNAPSARWRARTCQGKHQGNRSQEEGGGRRARYLPPPATFPPAQEVTGGGRLFNSTGPPGHARRPALFGSRALDRGRGGQLRPSVSPAPQRAIRVTQLGEFAAPR